MEVLGNADVAGEMYERAEYGSFTQLHIVQMHHVGGAHLEELHAVGQAALRQFLANRAVGNGDVDAMAAARLGQPFGVGKHTMAITLSVARVIIHKH